MKNVYDCQLSFVSTINLRAAIHATHGTKFKKLTMISDFLYLN